MLNFFTENSVSETEPGIYRETHQPVVDEPSVKNEQFDDLFPASCISFWVFLAAGAGAMLITLITVSFQAIKAALANPVKSLRTE
jgi:hypothetical protein